LAGDTTPRTTFDLTARRTVTRSAHVNGAWEADVTVTVANARDTLAIVELVERRGRQVDILSSTLPAHRAAHNEFRFEIHAPAGGQGTVSYRVRYH
jgi:hypothetical protein